MWEFIGNIYILTKSMKNITSKEFQPTHNSVVQIITTCMKFHFVVSDCILIRCKDFSAKSFSDKVWFTSINFLIWVENVQKHIVIDTLSILKYFLSKMKYLSGKLGDSQKKIKYILCFQFVKYVPTQILILNGTAIYVSVQSFRK